MGMQEFSQVLKKEREARHLSQTQLSECMSVTPQAVSKWERARGCPDMDMLCKLASFFEVSLDYLWGREQSAASMYMLPDDGTLRILQCLGQTVLTQDTYDREKAIPLFLGKTYADAEMHVEVWGNAVIDGSIGGDVTVGGDISCGNVGGDATAAHNIDCGNVGGELTAGGSVDCGNVNGDVTAGDRVSCGNIKGDLIAIGDVTCGDIRCDVSAKGTVRCGDIGGDVTCEADIHCQNIGGTVGDAKVVYVEKQAP